MTGNDTRLIFSASLVNFPVGDFSIANFKQKNNYFHQIVMKLQQEVLCNTHFVQLERHSLLFRHYAFVDTKDYLADQLFIKQMVRAWFDQEYAKEGSPFLAILCHVKKKDSAKFLAALDALKNKMILCGYPEYEAEIQKMMRHSRLQSGGLDYGKSTLPMNAQG